MPPEKRRKWSPILSDRDDRKVRIPLNNGIFLKSVDLSCLLSLPKSFGKLESNVFNGDMMNSTSPFQCMQESPIKSYVAGVSEGTGESECVTGSPALLPPDDYRSNNQEVAQAEGDGCIEVRNICTSRWAYQDDSPAEVYSGNHVDVSTLGVVDEVDSLNPLQTTKLTSESRVFHREGSNGSWGNSFEYDPVDSSIELGSGDSHSDNEGINHGFMEIDESHVEVAHVGYLDQHTDDGHDSFRSQKLGSHKPKGTKMFPGCREVSTFEKLNRINEGTYGVVYKARDKSTGEIVALKKVKKEVEKDGFPVSFLREINLLLTLQHPSIVHVKEVVVTGHDDVLMDDVFMVMEYVQHDLKVLMQMMKQPFSEKEVKCLMLQLLEGVKYLHDNWVLHRDLKTSNLLLSTSGKLKICDLGISRRYGSPLKPYTPSMVTLWYRAPELLLGAEEYSTAVDMWSVGCVMAELLAKQPLFNGDGEIDQLSKIFNILGTPNEGIWPGFSNLPGVKRPKTNLKQRDSILHERFYALSFTGSTILSAQGFNFLSQLLTYDPKKRITAEDALKHPWLHEEAKNPLPGQEALAKKVESITNSSRQ